MRPFTAAWLLLACTTTAAAAPVTVTMHRVDAAGVQQSLGTVDLEAYRNGTRIRPRLQGLAPGLHGFHLHAKADCSPTDGTAAGAAGGHFDPDNTGQHEGPYGMGHLGDLPALWVDGSGRATQSLYVPRMEPKQFVGHALIIHRKGDNYADRPAKGGGGGPRVACGVVR